MTRFLLLGASLTILSTPSFAQTSLALSEVVTVGQRIGNTSINTLSAPVSVLTETDINKRDADYVSDLLRSLPGIAVSSTGGPGQITQIRLRGSEANHVLVLIDGVEVANPSDGAFDFAAIPAANIVRIEVLRGEASALYGSDAIGGVINIITHNGTSTPASAPLKDTDITLNLEAGTLHTIQGSASARFVTDLAQINLNASAIDTDGFDISALSDEDDGHSQRSVGLGFSKLNVGPAVLSGSYNYSSLDSEFDSSPAFGSSDNTLDRDIHAARLSASFDTNALSHLINASYQDTQTDSFGNSLKADQSQISWTAKWSQKAHNITGLIEAEEQAYRNGSSIEGDNDSQSLALDYRYAPDNGPLSLTASARHDFNSLFEDSTTWTLGANYELPNWPGNLRASIGTGVKNPTLIELFGFTPGATFLDGNNQIAAALIGNPDLEAEESLGFNLGYTHRFDKGFVSLDYFQSDLENEIFTVFGDFTPDFSTRLSADTVDNRDTDSTREGVEFEGRWAFTDRLSLRASSTWLDSEENNVTEVRRPEWIAHLSADWQASPKLDVNLTANYTGSQIDTDFVAFQRVTLDSYTLVSTKLRYRLDETLALHFRAENLLDEDYQEVFANQSPPITVHFGLSANF